MEPIGWRRINELAGIVSPGPHGCADDVGQVPGLQNVARGVHFDVHGPSKDVVSASRIIPTLPRSMLWWKLT